MKTHRVMEIQLLAFTVALNGGGWSADVLATLVLNRQEVVCNIEVSKEMIPHESSMCLSYWYGNIHI